MQKRKALMLIAFSVLGNCLGNLSTDFIRGTFGAASKALVAAKKNQQNKERLAARNLGHTLALTVDCPESSQ